MTNSQLNMQDILKDPTAYFDNPFDIEQEPRLNSSQKQQILESWEQDARALIRAENENMTSSPGQEAKAAKLLENIFKVRSHLKQ